MRIKHLAYRNFKGHSADIELAPVTLVTGANFNHKTAIPMAIRLALTGYLPPPLGVRGIYALAGNPNDAGEMSITLLLENARKVIWKWKRDAAGKVSVIGNASPDIAMPQLLMEPKLFFAKTAADQVQTVFAACDIGPDSFAPETLKARFAEVQNSPLAECERTIAHVGEWMEQHLIKNVPAWISEFLDALKTKQKAASDEAKVASGAFAAFRVDAPTFQKDVSKELAAARENLRSLEIKTGGSVEGLQGQLALLKGRLGRYLPSVESYDVQLRDTLARLGDSAKGPDDVLTVQDGIDELVGTLAETQTGILKAKTRLETLRCRIHEIENVDCCPVCKAKRPGWKKASLDELKTQIAAEEGIIAELITQSEAKTEALTKLQTWLADVNAEKSLTAGKSELTGLMEMIAKVGNQIAEQDKAAGGNSIAIASLKTEVAELEAKQSNFELWQKDRGRKDSLEQQMLFAQCRADTYKAIIKIVVEEQGKLVNKAFTEVLKTARHFTDALLNSPLEFTDGALGRRVSNQDVQMGCQAPIGSWISFDTFSGTEELLALAGFGVALSHEAPSKLVILDELGRLDPKRKLDVALRMLSLVESGIIDQSILIDVDPKAYAGLSARQGFKIVSL